MKHCGMDVHLQSTTAEVLDPRTGEIARRVVATERSALKRWLASEPRMRVVLEAGRSSHWVAELAEECGHEVIVVDPNRTKAVAVAGGHKKTDRLDAATLAWLSTKDALVVSHRAPTGDRQRRRTLTLRQRLVRCRGDLVRAVRAGLAAEGIRIRGTKPRGFSGAVKGVVGDDATVGVLARVLEVIDVVEENIDECDRLVELEAESDPVVRLLMTADGVGPVVGTAFRVAVGTPDRFQAVAKWRPTSGLHLRCTTVVNPRIAWGTSADTAIDSFARCWSRRRTRSLAYGENHRTCGRGG